MNRGRHNAWRFGMMLAFAAMACPAHADSRVPQVACSAIKVPGHTRLTITAPRIVIDDMPMAILMAQSTLSPEEFAEFYKKIWKGPGEHPLYVVNRIGKWNVVAHKEGKCLYTVQILRGKKQTTALLGVGEPEEKTVVMRNLQFPTPSDARPLTHMVSDDSGTVGDTWLFYSNDSVAQTLRFFKTTLPRFGWHDVLGEAGHPNHRMAGRLLMYSNGRRDAGVVVAPFRKGSAITLTVRHK